MYSQYRQEKGGQMSYMVKDIAQFVQEEIQNSELNMQVFDPVITHVMLRLQPWILTIMVVFGLYFILILAILILILRTDIKK